MLTKASDVGSAGWHLLYLDLAGKQCSWHIAPGDVYLFDHVPLVDTDDPRARWDGHTTEEKYQRIAELTANPAFPLPVRPDGTHFYVSTYCVHSDHAACRLTCLCCGQPCQCAGCEHETAAEDETAPDLTREELQGLVDELGTQAYRAEDVLAFIAEMCDAADADGSEVTTARVRSWLGYTGCGGVIVLPEEAQASFRERLLAKYPVTMAELDAEPDPNALPNAEDCPQCTDPNPPYPFICPGHPADIPLTGGNTPDIEGEGQ